VWDLGSGRELTAVTSVKSFGLLRGAVAVFDPAGERLAVLRQDNAVAVIDAREGWLLQTLSGHSAEVRTLAFSPDGRRLASGGSDQMVRVWDPQRGDEVLTLRSRAGDVARVTWSGDGRFLAAVGVAGGRVWDAGAPQGPAPVHESYPEPAVRYHEFTFGNGKRIERIAHAPKGKTVALGIEALAQLEAATDDLSRAKILAGSGQWGMAAEAFAKAAAKDPDNLQLRYQQIDALGKAGNPRVVEPARKGIQTSFEAKLAKDPKDMAAAAALAQLYHLLSDQPALDKLLDRHPTAAAGIGDLYAADKNWERAIAEYTKAITPETKDAKLLAKRAEAYEKLKRRDLAVSDWTRAWQQQPDVAFQRFKPVGAGSWQFRTGSSAAGSMEDVDGTLVLTPTIATGTPWDVQAYQDQLQLENGAEYVIRFKMKSPDSHTVLLIGAINQGDYHVIGLNESIIPPSEFKDYEFTFVPHDVVPGNNRIGFDLGKNRGKIMVKDIVILKK